MAVSAMLGFADDTAQAVKRFLGRSTGEQPLPFESPSQMIAALHNPATEASAVSRMHRMHYGAFYNQKTRSSLSKFAESELLLKGKGFGGAIFGRPVKGLSIGISHLKGAIPFAPLQGAFEVLNAKRGHKISAFVGGTSKALAFAAGDLIGNVVGGPVAGLALGLVTERLGGYVEEGVQGLHDLNRFIKHVNMGGDYEDTRIAYTMRQRAAQELGTSVLNARQWLGKEAVLMHQ